MPATIGQPVTRSTQTLLNPTTARIRAVAVTAVAAAVVWVMVFDAGLASLWNEQAGLFAAVHLTGVAALTYAGLRTWNRRPSSRDGPLLIVAAFANHIAALQWFPLERQFVQQWGVIDVANWLGGLPAVVLLHAALTFPSGRFPGRLERVVIWFAYALILGFGWLLPTPLFRFVTWPGLLVMALAGVSITRRYAAASPAARRIIGPVPFVVVLISVAALFYAATEGIEDHSTMSMRAAQFGLAVTNPAVGLAFAASLLRMRLAGAGVGELVVRLQRRPGAEGVAAALRSALGDPNLQVGYWMAEHGTYIDASGKEISERDLPPNRVVTGITDAHGEPLAVLIHDAALAEEDALLDAVGAAAHLALENARLHAQLEMQLKEVQASRVRLVAAADAERRRVERNLHDGAQQQLVLLSLLLQEARAQADGDPQLRATIDAAAQQLQDSLRELRELARGIHPVILTRQGLREALGVLATRAPLSVTVEAPEGRYDEPVESTLYFVAAEAITNVAKHAGAREAHIRLLQQGARLVLEVTDDGAGGATIAPGGGLQGLTDRVAALGGLLTVRSRSSGGTVVRASIPARAATRPAPDDLRVVRLDPAVQG